MNPQILILVGFTPGATVTPTQGGSFEPRAPVDATPIPFMGQVHCFCQEQCPSGMKQA
jgi:hypothetical protein